MSFLKLVFKPGINRDQTNYSGKGGWSDGDKIRFFSGYPQKLGGWQKTTPETFIGVCRQVWNWVTSFTDNFLGVGTDIKLYIEVGGEFYDITPLREPPTLTTGAVTIALPHPTALQLLQYQITAHGALAGDYVTFSGAVIAGWEYYGMLRLIRMYVVTSKIDDDSFTFSCKKPVNGCNSLQLTHQTLATVELAP
jgi:hypothetical protein